jgi:hypothetical protein
VLTLYQYSGIAVPLVPPHIATAFTAVVTAAVFQLF